MKHVAVLLLFLAMPCVSQTPQKYSAKVKVLVTGSDDTLKNQVKSFVGRELRSLGDVSIVDENPDFVIALLIGTAVQDGSVVSIATLVSEPLHMGTLTAFLKLDNSQVESGKRYVEGLFYILDLTLTSVNRTDVEKACRQVIVDFDSKQLEPGRKLLRNIKER